MKIIFMLIVLSQMSFANDVTVKNCSIETMQNHIKDYLKKITIKAIKEKPSQMEIDLNTLNINYHGLKVFEDNYYVGKSKQHAFSLNFMTKEGKKVEGFSAMMTKSIHKCYGPKYELHDYVFESPFNPGGHVCFGKQQNHPFIFIQRIKTHVHKDKKDNITYSTCKVSMKSVYPHYRAVLFAEPGSREVIQITSSPFNALEIRIKK